MSDALFSGANRSTLESNQRACTWVFAAEARRRSLKKTKMVRMLQEGLELPTLGLIDPCSTKLSYQSYAAHAWDRTKDLKIFSLTLSQLSYMDIRWRKLWVVHPVPGAAEQVEKTKGTHYAPAGYGTRILC